MIARKTLSLLPLARLVLGFPTLDPDYVENLMVLSKHATYQRSEPPLPIEKRATIPFDPEAQRVDVSGQHAWQAPDFTAGDQRGPCPGLNALANHGYLPRNGVATWEDIATATNQVYGLGEDIAGFLAIYGAIFDGSIISTEPGYSIGGPAPGDLTILGGAGLLGTPQGLSGSHNKYESDSSSGRYDLYNGQNDYLIDMSRFNALYNLQADAANPSYDLTVWSQHRKNMFLKSVAENPYFFYAPFAGVIASTGGFTFPPRMMSNKSAEYPDNGILDKEMLKSFFSISGPDNNLKYTYGHERIPENFYKRAVGNEYDIPKFFEDFKMFASYFPEMVSTGGNTGKVNTYTAVSITGLTGNAYSGSTLLQGNNLECFVFQSVLAAAPDILKGGYTDTAGPMNTLLDSVNKALGDVTCPQIQKYNTDQFKKYPGYNASGGAA